MVKSGLGVALGDLIVGFIYVGTDQGGPATRAPRPRQEFAQSWTGDGAEPSPDERP